MNSLKLLISLFLISGCILNSKNEDADHFQTQKDRYLQISNKVPDQLIQNQKDLEQQNKQIFFQKSNNNYTVIHEKNSSWSVGSTNGLAVLGEEEFKYIHKIQITLVCDKESFVTKALANQNVKWKLNKEIKGESLTDRQGQFHIVFSDLKLNVPFSEIEIQTLKRKYNFRLEGLFIFQVNSEECL